GGERFRLAFDSIPFGLNHASGTVLDLARSHLSPTFYTYRLTGLEGGELPFARGAFGALRLEPGRHRIEVTMADAVTTLGRSTRFAFDVDASPLVPAAVPPPPPGTTRRTVAPDAAAEIAGPGYRLAIAAGAPYAP